MYEMFSCYRKMPSAGYDQLPGDGDRVSERSEVSMLRSSSHSESATSAYRPWLGSSITNLQRTASNP